MLNRRSLITLGLVCAVALGSIGAQARGGVIPFVDIDTTKTTVSTLQAELDALTTENDTLKKEIADNRAKISSNQKDISELSPILEGVKSKGIELFSVLSNITDKNMRSQADQAVIRNKDLEKRLQTKITDLSRENTNLNRDIASKQKKVDVNDAKIQRNRDEIVILQASIAKTENQQNILSAYIKDVDTFQNNAEAKLK